MATVVDYYRILERISKFDRVVSTCIEELYSLLVFDGFPKGQEPKLAMTASRSLYLYWDFAEENGYPCDAMPIEEVISAMVSFGHVTPGMFSGL